MLQNCCVCIISILL